MTVHRRVILLVESTSSYGRGCLRGIARYARAHGGWTFKRRIFKTNVPVTLQELRGWAGDGVIARIESDRLGGILRELGLPTVDLRNAVQVPGFGGVYTDDRRVVELAIEHFVSNGLKHLAFCGYPGVDFSEARQRAFEQIDAPGCEKHVYAAPHDRHWATRRGPEAQREAPDVGAIASWLLQLPKPTGVLACNDTRGLHLLEACEAAGVRVPFDVAAVGVDDDDVLCELCNPALSSVAPNVEAIGFDAASLLNRLMDGQPPPDAPILIPPIALEVRESSDSTALADPVLIQAVQFMRTRAGEGINVQDVVAHVGTSRSTFERQCQHHLGCTPHEFLMRCRIDRVERLLAATDYSLAQIAHMSGFQSCSYMISVFRARAGQTPSQYRRARQPASSRSDPRG